jgi:hypothetical protein
MANHHVELQDVVDVDDCERSPALLRVVICIQPHYHVDLQDIVHVDVRSGHRCELHASLVGDAHDQQRSDGHMNAWAVDQKHSVQVHVLS